MRTHRTERGGTEWPAAARPGKSEPVPPRLARNTIFESTFEVGRRFRGTMRVDCGQLEPGAVIGRSPANGTRVCPSASTKRELADWHASRNAVYQLAARTIGARLAVADA